MKAKILFIFWLGLILCQNSVSREMTQTELKLYHFVLSSQIRNHKYDSYLGSWPTVATVENIFDFEMTSSFEIVQILLMLRAIEEAVSIPDEKAYLNAFDLGYRQLDQYLNHNKFFNDPDGSINFYPFLSHQLKIRGYPSVARDLAFRFLGFPMQDLNVPNDLDCSARTFALVHDLPEKLKWSQAFPQTAGKWIDINRRKVHPSEFWKQKDSGAFLTWIEEDSSPGKTSRIIGGVNDVDCVVNLNVLEALGISEQNKEMHESVLQAKENSCKMINKVMFEGINGSIRRCSVYYQRPSQVLHSYSRATVALQSYGVESNCLQISKSHAIRMALELAENQIRFISPKNQVLTKAELVVALKLLIPIDGRPSNSQKILDKLEGHLRSNIRYIDRQTAFIPAKDSMYFFKYRNFKIEFWSKAYSTALVLLALTLP